MPTTNSIHWTDADVINADYYAPDSNRAHPDSAPWLLHDHGFVVAVVFAENLQEALDTAADADKLERYLLNNEDWVDYDGPEDDRVFYLGNNSLPYNIESLVAIELANPPFSFAALYSAAAMRDAITIIIPQHTETS